MTVLQMLENISVPEIDLIVREYENMPLEEFRIASRNARTAAACLRKPTWSLWEMTHVNALLLGFRKLKYQETYSVMKMIAAVEIYSHATMGQPGITYTDYNLCIGPVASVLAPDQFVDEQGWEIETVKEPGFTKPYRPASYRASMTRKIAPVVVPKAEKVLSRAANAALAVGRTERRRPAKTAPTPPSSKDLLKIMGVKAQS